MPGAAPVGLVDRDVQPGVAHRLPRGGESPAVTELGKDRDRRQLADPVMGIQRPASRLAARVDPQLLVQRRDLCSSASVIAIATMICSRAASGRRPARAMRGLRRSAGATRVGEQPVVVEHRTDPLLPLAALVDERVTNPTLEPNRADGRAGSTTPAAARSSTAPADASRQPGRSWAASCSRATRSSRPAQRDAPRRQPAQLLDDEPPARRRLERDLELLAGKPAQEPAHALTVRRRHPRPADLASDPSSHSPVICAPC